MSELINEVATPVATQEEHIPTLKEIFAAADNYNLESLKRMIFYYSPETLSNHVLRCLLKYLRYVIADPDYCANQETVEHAAMLESLYYALSEMNDEPEEEEEE